MKTPALTVLFTVAGLLTAGTSVLRASVAKFEELGGGTYSYTREASTSFDRNVDKLAEEAKEDAAKYCAQNGKQAKVISVSVDKAWPTLGFSKATVVFRALEPGDRELADQTPVPVMHAGKKAKRAAEAAPAQAPVDELYNSLMKLDELRRRGLLTDEEFQMEKKKVLERSR